MLAVRGGHAKTVQVLIEAGANVNLRNQVRMLLLVPMEAKKGNFSRLRNPVPYPANIATILL